MNDEKSMIDDKKSLEATQEKMRFLSALIAQIGITNGIDPRVMMGACGIYILATSLSLEMKFEDFRKLIEKLIKDYARNLGEEE